MRRALIDIKVVLDVLLDREPHAAASAAVWAAIETGRVEGLLAGHAVATTHYLIRKEQGMAKARRTLSAMLRVLGVAAVDAAVIREALHRSMTDFEDSVTASAARLAGCDLLVTRNPKDFQQSPVRVLTPEEAIPLFART